MEEKLKHAIGQLTVEMFESIEHGEEIELNDTYTFYRYCEEDIYVIVKDAEWEERLQIMIDLNEKTFVFESI